MFRAKTSFSAFLLKDQSVGEVERALFSTGLPLTDGLDGKFVAIPSQRKEPSWLRAIRPHLGRAKAIDVFGESPAGMMLIFRGRKAFVITFGHAWQRIESRWVEPDFGRRVALNAVPPDRVVELGSQQVFAKKHVARERAPYASDVREFSVEYDRDLVAAIEGVPTEAMLGGSLRGSISLRASVHFPTLGAFLDRALVLFRSNAYKNRWPEIDNIVPVTDVSRVIELDLKLSEEIESGDAKDKAALFSPSLVRGDLSVADAFAIGSYSAGTALSPYLIYGSWESYLARKGKSPSLKTARETPVHLFDDAGDRIERSTVYQCLTYELTYKGNQYVLASGTWYKADDTFLNRVNKYISDLRPSPIRLPDWDGTEKEGLYNERCCRGSDLLFFDARNVWYGGKQSKFEFCDFIHPTQKVLFFAKIASKASGCSHLVEQVRRTEELLFNTDGTYRGLLKKVFEKYHPRAKRGWLDDKPNRGEWTLCLVSLGRERQDLPFFAKCSVWRLARSLENLGHKVCFAKV